MILLFARLQLLYTNSGQLPQRESEDLNLSTAISLQEWSQSVVFRRAQCNCSRITWIALCFVVARKFRNETNPLRFSHMNNRTDRKAAFIWSTHPCSPHWSLPGFYPIWRNAGDFLKPAICILQTSLCVYPSMKLGEWNLQISNVKYCECCFRKVPLRASHGEIGNSILVPLTCISVDQQAKTVTLMFLLFLQITRHPVLDAKHSLSWILPG